MPLTPSAHCITRSCRAAQMPTTSEIANAMASDVTEMTMCCHSATATWSQLRRNQVIAQSRPRARPRPLRNRARAAVVVEHGDARADAVVDPARAGTERCEDVRGTQVDGLRGDHGLDRDQRDVALAHRVELGDARRRHRRVVLDALGHRQEVERSRIREVTDLRRQRSQRFLRGREARLLRSAARELQRQVGGRGRQAAAGSARRRASPPAPPRARASRARA